MHFYNSMTDDSGIAVPMENDGTHTYYDVSATPLGYMFCDNCEIQENDGYVYTPVKVLETSLHSSSGTIPISSYFTSNPAKSATASSFATYNTSGDYTIEGAPNDEIREGYLANTYGTNNGSVLIPVIQSETSPTIIDLLDVSVEGITYPVSVENTGSWFISNLPNFVSTNIVSGTGNIEFTITISANASTLTREAVLTVEARTPVQVNIQQSPLEINLASNLFS